MHEDQFYIVWPRIVAVIMAIMALATVSPWPSKRVCLICIYTGGACMFACLGLLAVDIVRTNAAKRKLSPEAMTLYKVRQGAPLTLEEYYTFVQYNETTIRSAAKEMGLNPVAAVKKVAETKWMVLPVHEPHTSSTKDN
jgi:hypothetical protein